MPVAPPLAALFRDYAENHRDPVNVRLHKIAIPLIVFHLVAMLDWVPIFALPASTRPVTLAHLAYLVAVGWYLRLDAGLGSILAVLFALCFPLAWVTPRPLVVLIAIFAWGLQLAGHTVWEKRRPAFVHNLVHVLVGPAYFVATGLRRWPAPNARGS